MLKRKNKLPNGWEITQLDSLGNWHGGGTPSKSKPEYWKNGTIPWVSPKDMKTDIINKPEDYITENAVLNSSAKMISELSVLVVTRSGILQRILPVAINEVPVTTNQDIKALTPYNELCSRFIAFFLKAHDQQIRDDCAKTGTTVASIDLPKLKNFQIELPPANEQKRIVKKIESLQARSQRAREALTEVGPLLEQFRQSVLAAAFRGDLTADWRATHPNVEPASVLLERIRKERRQKWEAAELAKYKAKGKQPPKNWQQKYKEPEPVDTTDLPELPEGWEWAKMQELAKPEPNSICAGPFGTIFKAKDFREKGIPIIFLRHIAPGRYLTSKPGFMDIEKWEDLFQSYSVHGGELLVTKLGDPPGVAALYPEDIGVAMVTPDVMKMSVNENVASNSFLMHYLNSDAARQYTFGVSYGVTRLRMNLTIFRNIPVPIAPYSEQIFLRDKLNSIFETIEEIKIQVENKIKDLAQLDQSILSKAFRGELVPQDPNDEPAAELLARIKAARAGEQPTRKKQPAKRKPKKTTGRT